MRLHVTGYTESTPLYRNLWGFYVNGFRPRKHCQGCFAGSRAKGIQPGMGNARVDLPKQSDFFYLCGYANEERAVRGKYNLHLAVRSKAGSVASLTSAYGPVFTIEDAEQIEIPEPTGPHCKWTEFDYRCKNMLFAKKMYNVSVVGPDAQDGIVRLPKLN